MASKKLASSRAFVEPGGHRGRAAAHRARRRGSPRSDDAGIAKPPSGMSAVADRAEWGDAHVFASPDGKHGKFMTYLERQGIDRVPRLKKAVPPAFIEVEPGNSSLM